MQGGIVDSAVLPAAPHDPDSGADEDAGGVGMVFGRGSCSVVDVDGPGAGEAAVRGEGREGHPEAFVASPTDATSLAERFTDRGDADQRGHCVGLVERIVGIAHSASIWAASMVPARGTDGKIFPSGWVPIVCVRDRSRALIVCSA